MLTKELFIESVEAIEKEMNTDDKIHNFMQDVMVEFLCTKDMTVIYKLVEVLETHFPHQLMRYSQVCTDTDWPSPISRWVYRMDREKGEIISFYDKDGNANEIFVANAGELYDHLVALEN